MLPIAASMIATGLVSAISFLPFASPDYDILPPSIPEKLSFRPRELPESYHLVEPPNMLERMGMKQNPDYITNLSDMESIAQRGGMASFLAIYGKDQEPRLLLNGVYFRNPKQCDEFVKFQQNKKRLIAAFKLQCGQGLWLLLVAHDPDISYSKEEKNELRETLEKYQNRLKLEKVFNDF